MFNMQVFEDKTGKVSSMRIGFLACLLVGAVLCISGVFAAFHGVESSSLVTGGVALMGSSGWAKAVQANSEKHDK